MHFLSAFHSQIVTMNTCTAHFSLRLAPQCPAFVTYVCIYIYMHACNRTSQTIVVWQEQRTSDNDIHVCVCLVHVMHGGVAQNITDMHVGNN